MVLEAGDRPPLARLKLALEEHVADHPLVSGDGLEREKADARHVLAVKALVAAAEQLVAAAHGEHRGAAVDRFPQCVSLEEKILRDEQLLAILAAADVVEVVRAGNDVVSDADRGDLELVPAPRRPPREHRDVAAVRVDIEVIGVEVADADVHDQYAFVRPRAVRMRCRPSIAVYVGRTTSSPPGGVSSSPRSSAAARSGCTSIASSSSPP